VCRQRRLLGLARMRIARRKFLLEDLFEDVLRGQRDEQSRLRCTLRGLEPGDPVPSDDDVAVGCPDAQDKVSRGLMM
jgi:hypothetical protein